MKYLFKVLILFLYFIPNYALANANEIMTKRVVILDFKNGAQIPDKDLELIVTLLRGSFIDSLGDHLSLLSKENLRELLPEGITIEDCDGTCEVQTGRLLQAHFVVTGKVLSFSSSSKLQVIINMHDTMTSNSITSVRMSGSLADVEKQIPQAAKKLVSRLRKHLGLDGLRVERSNEEDFTLSIAKGRESHSISSTSEQSSSFIIIKSEQETTIYIDDQLVGDTPLQLPLFRGKHTLKATRPMYHTSVTNFEMGNANLELNIKLKPTFGTIEINSDPSNALIYLNGENIGKTPMITKRVSSKYSLQIKKACYTDYEQEFQVEENQNYKLMGSMSYYCLSSKVNSQPSGALIYVNGKNTGKRTPATIDGLKPGYNLFKLTKSTYLDSSQRVNIFRKRSKGVNFELKPKMIQVNISAQWLDGSPCVGNTFQVNGQFYGQLPWSGKLQEGQYDITVACKGDTISKKVSVQPKSKRHIALKMTKHEIQRYKEEKAILDRKRAQRLFHKAFKKKLKTAFRWISTLSYRYIGIGQSFTLNDGPYWSTSDLHFGILNIIYDLMFIEKPQKDLRTLPFLHAQRLSFPTTFSYRTDGLDSIEGFSLPVTFGIGVGIRYYFYAHWSLRASANLFWGSSYECNNYLSTDYNGDFVQSPNQALSTDAQCRSALAKRRIDPDSLGSGNYKLGDLLMSSTQFLLEYGKHWRFYAGVELKNAHTADYYEYPKDIVPVLGLSLHP